MTYYLPFYDVSFYFWHSLWAISHFIKIYVCSFATATLLCMEERFGSSSDVCSEHTPEIACLSLFGIRQALLFGARHARLFCLLTLIGPVTGSILKQFLTSVECWSNTVSCMWYTKKIVSHLAPRMPWGSEDALVHWFSRLLYNLCLNF